MTVIASKPPSGHVVWGEGFGLEKRHGIEMVDGNSGEKIEPSDVSSEALESPSDSVGSVISRGSSDSISRDDPPPLTAAEQRAENRRRRRMREDLARSMNMDDEESLRLLELLSEMMPDPSRMSTAEHIGDRLEHAMGEMRARHPRLVFTRRTRSPIDITDPKRFFMENADFAAMMDSEEDLLRALVVNDRARAGYERWLLEHEAVRSMLLTELVRRQTLNEQWRHLLPKFMLPVYSMVYEAGVKAKDLQVNSRLFNKVRDLLVEWSGGMIDKEALSLAAERTEDEFLAAVKSDKEDGSGSDESFEACQERLRFALAEARDDLSELVSMEGDEFDIEEAKRRVDRLVTAISIEAGMDSGGRLVFASVDSFMDVIAARRRSRRGNVVADAVEGSSGEGAAVEAVSEVEVSRDIEDVSDEAGPEEGELVDAGESEADEAVEVEAEAMDGPASDSFGPDIPEDLFGPDSLEDDDDLEEGGVDVPSDDSDHPFRESESEPGESSGDEAGAGEPLEGVKTADTDSGVQGSGSEGEFDFEADPELAPVGEGPPSFDPEDLDSWPSDTLAVRRIAPGLARSTGLSRSTFAKPFSMWRPSVEPRPFCFMGFRYQPDLSARQGQEGPIEPVDLSRMEISDGKWKAAALPGPSRILGQAHPLMLPPHSRLSWYGRMLGWGETEVRGLDAFGSPAKPETVKPKGDGEKLANAMRGVARLRIAELVQKVPGHFLADAKAGPDRREEAIEDLARYWIFVLLARHSQAEFDLMFSDFFFNGVHGPDFVVDATGKADFGSAERSGHIAVWAPEMTRKLPEGVGSQPFEGKKGEGVMSGMRRPTV